MSDRSSSLPRYFKDVHTGPFFSVPRQLRYLVRVDPDDSVWLEYADGVERKHTTLNLQEVLRNYKAKSWGIARLEDLEGSVR